MGRPRLRRWLEVATTLVVASILSLLSQERSKLLIQQLFIDDGGNQYRYGNDIGWTIDENGDTVPVESGASARSFPSFGKIGKVAKILKWVADTYKDYSLSL